MHWPSALGSKTDSELPTTLQHTGDAVIELDQALRGEIDRIEEQKLGPGEVSLSSIRITAFLPSKASFLTRGPLLAARAVV